MEIILLSLLLTAALYLLPVIVALSREHPSWMGIAVVDLLLGWTVIGWIIALAWACSGAKPNHLVVEVRRT
jgi:hypothetical protein